MCKKEFSTILITGANSGIGKQLAFNYAKNGITLYLTGRNKDRLKETAEICQKQGANVIFLDLDIRNKEEISKWILSCNKFKNIDLLIANAGISSGTFHGEKDDEIYDIYETNIIGTLNTILPIISCMKKQKKGQIAIISSMSSFISMPSCPAYSSSKACLTSLGLALRGKLKQYNIGVSTICPGFITTPLTDKNKFRMPLIMSAKKASKKIQKCIQHNKTLIVFPKTIYFLLKILNILPISLSNFIMSKLPNK